MKYEDIVQMNNKELHFSLKEERASLQKLKFNHAVSPIDYPSKITVSRKNVARLLTEMSKRSGNKA